MSSIEIVSSSMRPCDCDFGFRLSNQVKLRFGLRFLYVLAVLHLLVTISHSGTDLHTSYCTSSRPICLMPFEIVRMDFRRLFVAGHYLVVDFRFQMFDLRWCSRLLYPGRWSSYSVFIVAAGWKGHCLKNCSSDSSCFSSGWPQSYLVPCVERCCFRLCHLLSCFSGHFLKHWCCGSFCCRIDCLIIHLADSWTTYNFVAVGLGSFWCFYNCIVIVFRCFDKPYIVVRLNHSCYSAPASAAACHRPLDSK